jgi:SAM-dependent methyltransferase
MVDKLKHITIKKIRRELARQVYLYTGIYFFMEGVLSFRRYYILKRQAQLLKKQGRKSSGKFPITKFYPCYEDKNENAGGLGIHYFFQDLYIAQRIHHNQPSKHIDIGSRINGFVAHVASFREIEIYDIRPLKTSIPNVKFTQADLMNLDEKNYECTDSISCLHALEHFGLGRYGDPICFDGYLLGFSNIYKMLKKNGKFYFSVPMGKQRIEFHAHRVFSLQYLLEMINPLYEINIFSYIDDKNHFHENESISEKHLSDNFGCHFGCAIFELTKK